MFVRMAYLSLSSSVEARVVDMNFPASSGWRNELCECYGRVLAVRYLLFETLVIKIEREVAGREDRCRASLTLPLVPHRPFLFGFCLRAR